MSAILKIFFAVRSASYYFNKRGPIETLGYLAILRYPAEISRNVLYLRIYVYMSRIYPEIFYRAREREGGLKGNARGITANEYIYRLPSGSYFSQKLQVTAIDFSACHQNSSNVGDSPDFAEVTQKISAFTSNVTDLSFVYRAKEGERKSCDPAIRWNIRRNTSRTVSGCRKRKRRRGGG